jgi:hypothetical protein
LAPDLSKPRNKTRQYTRARQKRLSKNDATRGRREAAGFQRRSVAFPLQFRKGSNPRTAGATETYFLRLVLRWVENLSYLFSCCVPSMFDNSEVKVPLQPDRGEVVAKRKGVVARRGLEEAWSKRTSRCTRTGSEAYGAARAGN